MLNYVDLAVLDIHGRQKQQKRTNTFYEFVNAVIIFSIYFVQVFIFRKKVFYYALMLLQEVLIFQMLIGLFNMIHQMVFYIKNNIFS